MNLPPPVDVPQALARALEIKVVAAPRPRPPAVNRRHLVKVDSVAALTAALAGAVRGTTILLADGHYAIEQELLVATPRVTLRSASGDREKVVFDGRGRFGRILTLMGAADFVIADVTLANSQQYGLFVLGDSGCHRLLIENCVFHNIWTRGVKGTGAARPNDRGDGLRHPPSVVVQVRPTGGIIRRCLFYNDSIKPMDDLFGGDYIGGIDMMNLKDWIIADNIFLNIRGKNGGGRGAIFIWIESENVVAERNLIIGCDRGICFGNPSSTVVNMFGGAACNNFIVGGTGMAIEIDETCNTMVSHNSIWASDFDYDRTLNFARLCAGGGCFNNLVHGRQGCIVLPESVSGGGNVQGDLSGYFRDGPAGDLHLAEEAPHNAAATAPQLDISDDFDGRPRKGPVEIGAAQRE